MKNQKGEVVIAVMVVLMVGVMIFGHWGMGHGDHGGHHAGHMGHHMDENDHRHSEKDRQHMHDGNPDETTQHTGEEGK